MIGVGTHFGTGGAPRQRRLLISVLLALLVLSGCTPPPRTLPVTGRVTRKGVPLKGALVVFLSLYPDDRPAFAITNSNGRYQLQTYFTSRDLVPGAVPGEYAVTVEKRRHPELIRAMLKMKELGPGPKLAKYLREQSAHDIWPDGIPEGWPEGYMPSAAPPPKEFAENKEAQARLDALMSGLHLLPEVYASPETSPFRAAFDRSQEEWSFDFDLEE